MRGVVVFAALLDVGVLRRVWSAYAQRVPRHWPSSLEVRIPVLPDVGVPPIHQG
jgi:hypothetical protein